MGGKKSLLKAESGFGLRHVSGFGATNGEGRVTAS
jgi:hypothetical protein